MTAKKRKEAVIIPADLFFYPIPLTHPHWHLTRDELCKHFEAPKGRKAYMGNHEEFISFENSILTVKVNLNDGSENHLYLHVEKDELDVACTCGMPNEKLCYHAFMGLYGMCWLTEGFDCQELYWPGYYDAAKTKKFLDVKLGKQRIGVSSKPEYGSIFRSQIGFPDDPLPLFEAQTDKVLSLKAGNTDIYAFALCFATGPFRNRHFPVLLPFSGITGKDGLKVVSFTKFILPDKQPVPPGHHLHTHQLNELSAAIYKMVKPVSDLEKRDSKVWRDAKQTVFELWQNALPLLADYPYNQSYHLYWLKYLREKPLKMFMRDCRYSLERPSLTFQLSFHKDYFTFSVAVIVGSKAITVDHKPHLFVFDEQSHSCFLMRSIQDDDLLIWMLENGNKITILKEHFEEFDQSFLKALGDSYKVFYIGRSGVRLNYDYSLVKADFYL
jgi:hypothetical protein